MTKALTKKDPTQVDIAITGAPGRGFDNVSVDDLIIPRMRLLQGLSDAVANDRGKAGEFEDSLTGEILGDAIEIVPLGIRNGAVYFETGQGLVCRSSDGKTSVNGDVCATSCPFNEYHGKFHADGTPPKCGTTKEFLAVTRKTLNGEEMRPFVMSFVKTSFKEGKKFATMAYLAGGDIFSKSYLITSKKDKNDKGTFAVPVVRPGGILTAPELIQAEMWFNRLGTSNVIIEGSEVDADMSSAPRESYDSI